MSRAAPSDGFAYIDVPQETVAIGLLCGLMHHEGDGVIGLTEKGRTWLHEWCEKKIKEAKPDAAA